MAIDPWIAVLGVVIAATLTFIFSRRSEQEKQFWTARTRAYADYVTAVALRARVSPANEQRYQELSAKMDDASYRTYIYGSKGVVEALVTFEALWQQPNSSGGQREFLSLCA